jgi:hypothetical protein
MLPQLVPNGFVGLHLGWQEVVQSEDIAARSEPTAALQEFRVKEVEAIMLITTAIGDEIPESEVSVRLDY